MPQSVKTGVDVSAAGIAWAHFLGFWKDNVGTIAATLSVVWLALQMYTFIKNNYFKKS